jgi:hypothetical protein
VTDINVFVRRSRRSAEREAVGRALMRQQVNAGKLKVTWMSEEEKAAYRLQEPPDAGADRRGVYDSEPRPATRRAPRGDQSAGVPRLASDRSPRVTSCGSAGSHAAVRSSGRSVPRLGHSPLPLAEPVPREVSERSEDLTSGRAAGRQGRRALIVSTAGAQVVAACLRLARGCRRAVWSR